jgi:hypothetical protein
MFGNLLSQCNLTADILKVIEAIETENLRESDLDDSILSEMAQQIKINTETYKELLPELYLKQFEGLQKRDPEEWINYEQFVNCVVLTN